MAPAPHRLHRLLSPRHLAVIGGESARIVVEQCREIGFPGEIWPVNPRRDEIAGLPCYPSLSALPEAPDAAFVGVPREATIDVVGELAALGAGGAVCYAAGFAECGAEGAALQERLVSAAGDMPVSGPNCYGLINHLDGAALWPEGDGCGRIERGVALVMQSGNIALNLTMQQRSLPIAYVISAGNQACLGLGDYVDALIEDPRVSAIGLYIEGLTDVPGFAKAAARALEKGVPLVALKTGNSEMGARIALSHTSSLAGTETLYDALFDRLGVLRVKTLGAFIETLKYFAVAPPLAGNRLAVTCCSGGEASLAADLAADLGLDLPSLTEVQIAEMSEVLSDIVTIANPLDYNTVVWGNRDGLTRAFTSLVAGEVDGAVLLIDYPHPETRGYAAWDVASEALIAASAGTGVQPVLLSTLPELLPRSVREDAIARGAVPLQGLDEGFTALSLAARYGVARRSGNVPAELLVPGELPCPAVTLDEWESKQRLAAYGLAAPEGRLVAAEAAPVEAAKIGFPVVLKAVSADLAHKTEAGAVALNLESDQAVAEAVARMAPLGAERFLVERMVTDGVAELILGIQRDPQFGLVLVIGSGGVLVELMADSRSLLLPTNRDQVMAALESLKGFKLLTGFRGRAAGDVEAVVEAALALARFAQDHAERLAELDVNPLIVRPAGHGVVVADALIRLADEGE
ncbi:MAG: acetate--CoA ligase family protein [Pseudomonadota bacterium]